MRRLKSVGWLIAVLASTQSARPATIEYQFSGTVQSIEPGTPETVRLGDRYTASWVFEMDTPDSAPLYSRGQYEGVAASLIVSDLTLSGAGRLGVVNDTIDLLYFSATPYPGFTAVLEDPTGVALWSEALPTQIHIDGFADRYVQVFFDSGKFLASIDSAIVTIVPEPSAIGLLLTSGLIVCRPSRRS